MIDAMDRGKLRPCTVANFGNKYLYHGWFASTNLDGKPDAMAILENHQGCIKFERFNWVQFTDTRPEQQG